MISSSLAVKFVVVGGVPAFQLLAFVHFSSEPPSSQRKSPAWENAEIERTNPSIMTKRINRRPSIVPVRRAAKSFVSIPGTLMDVIEVYNLIRDSYLYRFFVLYYRRVRTFQIADEFGRLNRLWHTKISVLYFYKHLRAPIGHAQSCSKLQYATGQRKRARVRPTSIRLAGSLRRDCVTGAIARGTDQNFTCSSFNHR